MGAAFDNVDSVIIAKVDADADRTLGGRFGVKGFPTIKFFPKGSTEPEEYVGNYQAVIGACMCMCRHSLAVTVEPL